MLELYTVKDNKFSPLLVDDILKKIKTETSYFVNSENDTEFKIIQFLAENGTSENEIIIIYEILYNIYRGNTTVKEIANYLKENNLDISYQSLFLFFENNSGDITEDIRQYGNYLLYKNIPDLEIDDYDFSPDDIVLDYSTIDAFIKSATNVLNKIKLPSFTSFIRNSARKKIGFDAYFKEKEYFSNLIEDNNAENIQSNFSFINYKPKNVYLSKLNFERYAFDYYTNILYNSPYTEISSDLPGQVWKNIADCGLENSHNLSSNRIIPKIMLINLPTRAVGSYNKEYSELLKWVNNTDFGDVNYHPNLGTTKTYDLFWWFATEVVNDIEMYNAACNKILSKLFSSNLFSLSTSFLLSVLEDTKNFLFNFNDLFNTNSFEGTKKQKKALELAYSLAFEITKRKIDFKSRFYAGKFTLDTYNRLFDEYVNSVKSSDQIETEFHWEIIQFLIGIREYFYDPENDSYQLSSSINDFYTHCKELSSKINTLKNTIIDTNNSDNNSKLIFY